MKHHFPNLKVMGEESAESLEKVEVELNAQNLSKDYIS